MKRSLLVFLCAMTGVAAHAADAVKAAAKSDPAGGRTLVTAVCASCHGTDGNSPLAANPKLAGQHPEYLLKQMRNFKAAEGKPPERVNALMNGIIAPYNDAQLRDMAAYLATQTQKGEAAKNRETVEFGQKLYRSGDQAKGLPACAACHGPTGAGIPGQYPRIGGQFSDYTELQLKTFRQGARANDLNKMMRMVAIKMTDAEIAAVSDYIAGLR